MITFSEAISLVSISNMVYVLFTESDNSNTGETGTLKVYSFQNGTLFYLQNVQVTPFKANPNDNLYYAKDFRALSVILQK